MEDRMNVTDGDCVVVESERGAPPPQTGLIDQGLNLGPPRYRIRWDDERTSIIVPASGAVSVEEGDAEGAERGNADESSDLCRSVNERIREADGARIGEYEFICECGDSACTQVMRMREREYAAVRSDPGQFAVLPGHEQPMFEDVLRRTDRYALVRKHQSKRGDRRSRAETG
jgi:Domain of unknown function (DUF1918)